MRFSVGDSFEDELTITDYCKMRSAVVIMATGLTTGQHTFTFTSFMNVVKNCEIRNGVICGKRKYRYYKQGSRIAIMLDET